MAEEACAMPPVDYCSVLLASREYSLSTPLLLIALTAKYPGRRSSLSMTAEVMVKLADRNRLAVLAERRSVMHAVTLLA